MSQMMLYVVPLILGRTFNLDQLEVGVDIFAKNQISDPIVLENPTTETHYKIVDNTKEARDLLDVSGSFRIKAKGGAFNAGAGGAYLTDVYNRENTVEVVVRATYQTATETLAPSAQPIQGWQAMSSLGTHYVRSITYGGELIASIRLISNNTRDKQHIKAALEVGGRIEVFDIGVEAEGEYLKDISKAVDTMEIKVFSSVPLNKIPHDMDELKAMMKNFPEDLKKFNNGRGVPLKVELYPLSYLDSTRPKYLKNRVLEAKLDAFEEKFDDLLNTKSAITDWMKVIEKSLTEEQEKEVGNFYNKIEEALREFYKVIGKLDMSQGFEQLKPAIDAYGKKVTGHYYHSYLKLRQQVSGDQGEWTINRGSGATYVHWGRDNCTEASETLYAGYAGGPSRNGGGYNFLCLPKQPEQAEVSSDTKVSILKGVTYKMLNGNEAALLCSTCRLANRGTAEVFPGRTKCPADWDLLYDGLLMSGSNDLMYTSFICLETNLNPEVSKTSDSPLITNWAHIINSSGETKLFPCVVCAK